MYFALATPQLPPGLPNCSAMPMSRESQIKEALIERTAALGVVGGDVIPYPTPELQLVQQLWHAKQLTSRLIRSKVAQFSIIRKPDGVHLQSTSLGSEVLYLLSILIDARLTHHPCHLFDPRVELFMECAGKRSLTPAWWPTFPMTEAQMLPFVDALNGFSQDVRKCGRTVSFRTKLADFQSETDKRFKEVQNYLKQLTDLYPDGHLIRMDFCYRPYQDVGFSFGTEMHKTVSAHGAALIKHLTTSLGSAVVGYAWKRDFAAARGYQYHLVAILHGPRRQELNNIVDSLGNHWREVITGGFGLSLNCNNSRTHDFKYRGLIAMDHLSQSMEEQLRQVPLYMTLTDGIVAFAPRGTAKPYGIGALPRISHEKVLQPQPAYKAYRSGEAFQPWPFRVSEQTGLS